MKLIAIFTFQSSFNSVVKHVALSKFKADVTDKCPHILAA